MYYPIIKRLIDIIASLLGLIILSPILIIIIIVLSIYNNGTPFFLQTRPGKKGIPFKIIKLKTMVDVKTGNKNEVHNMSRVTKLGSFLRKYSLDELLQLINVLKGDMSLVGPRPLLMVYVPLYNETQIQRLDVKPGVTGWAQVKGRNAISWDKKFEYDVWYVNNISLSLDIRIIFLTALKVIKKEGVNKGDDITMPEWTGNS